jgi:hypothetical protein
MIDLLVSGALEIERLTKESDAIENHQFIDEHSNLINTQPQLLGIL